jgi:hypothetical protein
MKMFDRNFFLRKIFGDFGGGWLSGSLGLFFSSEFGKN